MDLIKEIAIQEFFCHKFEELEEFFDVNKDYWKNIEDNYQCSICLSNFYCDKGDSKEKIAAKEKFLEAYAKCLKVHNALVFRYYFEILERVLRDKPDDYIVDIFFETNLYYCFYQLNPNFEINEELIAATKAWQEKNISKLTGRLDVLTERLTQRLNELPKLKKFNFDYLNLFDKKTIPELISQIEKAYGKAMFSQDEQRSGGGNLKPLVKSETKFLSAEEAIEKNFSNLIGFTKEKAKILNFAKYIKKSRVPVNMCFVVTGNPGVGKTTLGKVLHSTLYDIGVLKKDKFLAINGSDLKGKYVGWTGENVEQVFSSAKNGTLLIDEAYTLAGQYNDSFSNEALAKMMQQIDKLSEVQEKELSDKSLVILAGYEQETNLMIAQNQGANRRFANRIDLKDYTDDELFEIFKLRLKKSGNEISDKDEKLMKDMLAICTKRKRQEKNFANAGLIVNILEQAMQFQAGRAELDDYKIIPQDLENALSSLKEFDKVERIGF